MQTQIDSDVLFFCPETGISFSVGPGHVHRPDYVGRLTTDSGMQLNLRESISDNPQQHGAFVASPLYGARTVNPIILLAGRTPRDRELQFQRIFSACSRAKLTPWSKGFLTMQWHTADGFVKHIPGLRLSALPLPQHRVGPAKTCSLQFASGTPYIYGELHQPKRSGGGSLWVANLGTEAAWPRLVLRGPFTAAVVRNLSTNMSFRLDVPCGPDDEIVVDCRTASVVKNGRENVYYGVTHNGPDLLCLRDLASSTNGTQIGDQLDFQPEGDGIEDSSMTVEFRDTWV